MRLPRGGGLVMPRRRQRGEQVGHVVADGYGSNGHVRAKEGGNGGSEMLREIDGSDSAGSAKLNPGTVSAKVGKLGSESERLTVGSDSAGSANAKPGTTSAKVGSDGSDRESETDGSDSAGMANAQLLTRTLHRRLARTLQRERLVRMR